MKFYPYQPSSWQITIPGIKGVVGFLVRLENAENKKKPTSMSNHYNLHFAELGIELQFTKEEEQKAIEHAHGLIREKMISITQSI